MRQYFLAAACLFLGSGLNAQNAPSAAQPLDPAHNRLDAHLLNWQKAMNGIGSLQAQVSRTTLDKAFQTSDVFEGIAQFMRPNLAMLEMHKKDRGDVTEKYICSGTYLYEYVPREKVIRVHELPASKTGKVGDDSFLNFLFGMKAEETKQRYELKLVKEDQYWVYIEVLPRIAMDRADFQRARLVLNSQTYLPRQLWFEQPNGNEVKWDIPRIDGNARIARADFVSPTAPPGWTMLRVPAVGEAAPPRIYRPNQ